MAHSLIIESHYNIDFLLISHLLPDMKYHSDKLENLLLIPDRKRQVRSFIHLSIPSLLIILFLFSAIESYRLSKYQDIIIAEHKQSLVFYDDGISRDLGSLISDLHILANADETLQFISQPSTQTREKLEKRFLNYTLDRQVYDQIRFIDLEGNELIRVNYQQDTPQLVPISQLQNKAKRYYYRNTIKLGKGETYLSPLDLNMENGVIESPPKPVIRAATPLFDFQGVLKGILVFNYKAQSMLTHLKAIASVNHANLHLIDVDGYWLLHPESHGFEWGNFLGHGRSFTSEYPEVFRKIKSQPKGLIRAGNETFVFKRIYPLSTTAHSHTRVPNGTPKVNENYRYNDPWIIIIRVPPVELLQVIFTRDIGSLGAMLFIMLLLTYCCWMVAKQKLQDSLWEEFTNLMFHSIEQGPSAVVITDTLGNIQYINPAFIELTGYRWHEIIGKKPNILKSGQYPIEKYQALWKTITQGLVWEGELLNRRKDGTEYWVEQRISPIYNIDGEISHFVGIQVDTTERHDLFEELNHIARHDRLTGLMNRYLLESKFQDDINLAKRHHRDLSVLLIDIDYFKKINDEHGHQAGDQTLIDLSKIMMSECRETDYVSRYGGEEFVMVLPETGRNEAIHFAERLLNRISSTPVAVKPNLDITVTVSIGVASLDMHEDTMEALISNADNAMYKAKESGRNQVGFH